MHGASDIARLEKQNEQKTYDLLSEIKYFYFEKGDVILDAGCGSGLVTRAIAHQHKLINIKFEACDYSEIAVENAAKFFDREKIEVKAFVSDLENIQASNDYYDKVICRYVLEHMSNPLTALKEYYRVLKEGGKAYIIDLDGILFNLQSENVRLNHFLMILKEKLKFDLFVGRKITSLMMKAGFKDVTWEASMMNFNSDVELQLEYDNYVSRFNLAKPILIEALKTEELFLEFKDLYLQEMLKAENVLFYNKFYVTGTK